jgi:hypothetical protein
MACSDPDAGEREHRIRRAPASERRYSPPANASRRRIRKRVRDEHLDPAVALCQQFRRVSIAVPPASGVQAGDAE